MELYINFLSSLGKKKRYNFYIIILNILQYIHQKYKAIFDQNNKRIEGEMSNEKIENFALKLRNDVNIMKKVVIFGDQCMNKVLGKYINNFEIRQKYLHN